VNKIKIKTHLSTHIHTRTPTHPHTHTHTRTLTDWLFHLQLDLHQSFSGATSIYDTKWTNLGKRSQKQV